MLARPMACLTMLWMTFSMSSPVKEMFLNLMATLLAMQRAAKRSASQDFIASDDFKGIMKDRLRACLLSPNLTGYVLELADNVIAYAKKHPTTFKIPDGTFEDSEMSDVVTTFIEENLTAQRGSMKQKINHSLKTKANISVLAKSLASMGHEVTVAHWAHFAFLRSTFVSFQTVVEQAKATSAAQDSTVAVMENRDSEVIDSPEAPGPGPATSENEEPDGVTVADTIEKARTGYQPNIGNLSTFSFVMFFTSCLQDDMKRYVSTHSLIPTFDKTSGSGQSNHLLIHSVYSKGKIHILQYNYHIQSPVKTQTIPKVSQTLLRTNRVIVMSEQVRENSGSPSNLHNFGHWPVTPRHSSGTIDFHSQKSSIIGALLHTHPQSTPCCQLENLYCRDSLVQNKGAKIFGIWVICVGQRLQIATISSLATATFKNILFYLCETSFIDVDDSDDVQLPDKYDQINTGLIPALCALKGQPPTLNLNDLPHTSFHHRQPLLMNS
ncbi:uncharacterized protein F5147DRAFT_656388 [Suillus discolor]|uniref:Uncharacterized protein n=1 Tax=Suillus discolor TaxID=1912936 RepID=A0A9P7EZ60_9AGAM|nr:uncharacterized protein F5147DRAFT_656388 [Suillus discolor]KAG2097251.1 hypothetical protein F5147DRAFT_656388 [Suillus discolor]